MENKYANGKIYKIVDNGYNKCYIGATIESLSQRMTRHRKHYREFLNGTKQRLTLFDIFTEFGVENCKIELIEKFPCDSKEELTAREGINIRNTECVNKRIEGRTKEEYYNDNKVKLHDYVKQWRINNYDCMMIKNSMYRNNNKDAILAKNKSKQICECGCEISRRNMSNHQKSNKHKNLLQEKNMV